MTSGSPRSPVSRSRRGPHWLPARAGVALILVLLVSCGGGDVTVYAPASLADVLEELATRYRNREGVRVVTRVGASGQLAVEIEHGAPADIYISADPTWFDRLREKGLIDPQDTRLLAWNRLSVVVPQGVSILPQSLSFLPTFRRIAIGDPEFVPAGRYARQALENLGYWETVKDRVVAAPDVRAALALAERGEVDAAIVYATDARASDRVLFAFEIPERTHDPIVYPAGRVAGARSDAASAFLEFIGGAAGKAVFREHGFAGN